MTDTGIVKIHGKAYQTVALRVQNFREKYPDYGLRTTIIDTSEGVVIIRAEIWKDDYLLATGHAEERRGTSQINKTSALENCETSAIGRALASMGLGGTEFASANEVQNAVYQQNGGFINDKQVKIISDLIKTTDSDNQAFWNFAGVSTVDTIPASDYKRILNTLKAKADKMDREPGSDG